MCQKVWGCFHCFCSQHTKHLNGALAIAYPKCKQRPFCWLSGGFLEWQRMCTKHGKRPYSIPCLVAYCSSKIRNISSIITTLEENVHFTHCFNWQCEFANTYLLVVVVVEGGSVCICSEDKKKYLSVSNSASCPKMSAMFILLTLQLRDKM